MDIYKISKIVQLVVAGLLTVLVLFQSKGMGLSSALGNVGGYYRTRRGIEKLVFGLTIFLGIVFVINSLAFVLLS